jgi:hypothetical protein
MRNDARPIGEAAPLSAYEEVPSRGRTDDARESVTHDRQSHVVNEDAVENARRDDADVDPVMPTGDSTLNTKI